MVGHGDVVRGRGRLGHASMYGPACVWPRSAVAVEGHDGQNRIMQDGSCDHGKCLYNAIAVPGAPSGAIWWFGGALE